MASREETDVAQFLASVGSPLAGAVPQNGEGRAARHTLPPSAVLQLLDARIESVVKQLPPTPAPDSDDVSTASEEDIDYMQPEIVRSLDAYAQAMAQYSRTSLVLSHLERFEPVLGAVGQIHEALDSGDVSHLAKTLEHAAELLNTVGLRVDWRRAETRAVAPEADLQASEPGSALLQSLSTYVQDVCSQFRSRIKGMWPHVLRVEADAASKHMTLVVNRGALAFLWHDAIMVDEAHARADELSDELLRTVFRPILEGIHATWQVEQTAHGVLQVTRADGASEPTEVLTQVLAFLQSALFTPSADESADAALAPSLQTAVSRRMIPPVVALAKSVLAHGQGPVVPSLSDCEQASATRRQRAQALHAFLAETGYVGPARASYASSDVAWAHPEPLSDLDTWAERLDGATYADILGGALDETRKLVLWSDDASWAPVRVETKVELPQEAPPPPEPQPAPAAMPAEVPRQSSGSAPKSPSPAHHRDTVPPTRARAAPEATTAAAEPPLSKKPKKPTLGGVKKLGAKSLPKGAEGEPAAPSALPPAVRTAVPLSTAPAPAAPAPAAPVPAPRAAAPPAVSVAAKPAAVPPAAEPDTSAGAWDWGDEEREQEDPWDWDDDTKEPEAGLDRSEQPETEAHAPPRSDDQQPGAEGWDKHPEVPEAADPWDQPETDPWDTQEAGDTAVQEHAVPQEGEFDSWDVQEHRHPVETVQQAGAPQDTEFDSWDVQEHGGAKTVPEPSALQEREFDSWDAQESGGETVPEQGAPEEPAFDSWDVREPEQPVHKVPEPSAPQDHDFDSWDAQESGGVETVPEQGAPGEPAFDSWDAQEPGGVETVPEQGAPEEPAFDSWDVREPEQPVHQAPEPSAPEEAALDSWDVQEPVGPAGAAPEAGFDHWNVEEAQKPSADVQAGEEWQTWETDEGAWDAGAYDAPRAAEPQEGQPATDPWGAEAPEATGTEHAERPGEDPWDMEAAEEPSGLAAEPSVEHQETAIPFDAEQQEGEAPWNLEDPETAYTGAEPRQDFYQGAEPWEGQHHEAPGAEATEPMAEAEPATEPWGAEAPRSVVEPAPEPAPAQEPLPDTQGPAADDAGDEDAWGWGDQEASETGPEADPEAPAEQQEPSETEALNVPHPGPEQQGVAAHTTWDMGEWAEPSTDAAHPSEPQTAPTDAWDLAAPEVTGPETYEGQAQAGSVGDWDTGIPAAPSEQGPPQEGPPAASGQEPAEEGWPLEDPEEPGTLDAPPAQDQPHISDAWESRAPVPAAPEAPPASAQDDTEARGDEWEPSAAEPGQHQEDDFEAWDWGEPETTDAGAAPAESGQPDSASGLDSEAQEPGGAGHVADESLAASARGAVPEEPSVQPAVPPVPSRAEAAAVQPGPGPAAPAAPASEQPEQEAWDWGEPETAAPAEDDPWDWDEPESPGQARSGGKDADPWGWEEPAADEPDAGADDAWGWGEPEQPDSAAAAAADAAEQPPEDAWDWGETGDVQNEDSPQDTLAVEAELSGPSGTARAAPAAQAAQAAQAAPAASASHHAPPTRTESYAVSQRCMRFVSLLQQLWDARQANARFSESKVAASMQQAFGNGITEGVRLFCTLMPTVHAAALEHVPALCMLFANDCSHVASVLERWAGTAEPPLQRQLQDVEKLVSVLGSRWFEAQLARQASALRECLDSADGFTRTDDDARYAACERAVAQVSHIVQHLVHVWKDVLLPQVLRTTLGTLVDSVFQRMLQMIKDLEDISEPESVRLAALTRTLLEAMLAQFAQILGQPAQEDAAMRVAGTAVPSWFKFAYLPEILTGSLADVEFLLFDPEGGGALVDYTKREMSALIRALFADTPHRRRLLERVQRAALAA